MSSFLDKVINNIKEFNIKKEKTIKEQEDNYNNIIKNFVENNYNLVEENIITKLLENSKRGQADIYFDFIISVQVFNIRQLFPTKNIIDTIVEINEKIKDYIFNQNTTSPLFKSNLNIKFKYPVITDNMYITTWIVSILKELLA